MSKKLKSEGICIYCHKIYSKGGISRHLGAHLRQLEKEANNKKSVAFHIRVEAGLLFLQLLMNGNKPLNDLDMFLRQIWLECCGHMSQFHFSRYDEIPKGMLAKNIFTKGGKLGYIYDWGSSTELSINIINKYFIPMKESIRLLSRNQPLYLPCDACGKHPSTAICTVHSWDEDSRFCKKCAKKHQKECPDADYTLMDLCNSPRAGVCGYTGGAIDTARDMLSVS